MIPSLQTDEDVPPIHRLPYELLGHILLLRIKDAFDDSTQQPAAMDRTIASFLQAGRRIRGIALSIHVLWSYIIIHQQGSGAAVAAQLERSGDTLLLIKVVYDIQEYRKSNRLPGFNLLMELLPRWKSVEVLPSTDARKLGLRYYSHRETPYSEIAYHISLATRPLRLERLHVVHPGADLDCFPLTWTSVSNSLRSLRLTKTEMPWEISKRPTIPFPKLEELFMDGFHLRDDEPHFICNFVRQCLNLEHLGISIYRTNAATVTGLSTQELLLLPGLQSLELLGDTFDFPAMMLSLVRAPPLRRLKFERHEGGWPGSEILAIAPAARPLLRGLDTLEWVGYADRHSLGTMLPHLANVTTFKIGTTSGSNKAFAASTFHSVKELAEASPTAFFPGLRSLILPAGAASPQLVLRFLKQRMAEGLPRLQLLAMDIGDTGVLRASVRREPGGPMPEELDAVDGLHHMVDRLVLRGERRPKYIYSRQEVMDLRGGTRPSLSASGAPVRRAAGSTSASDFHALGAMDVLPDIWA